MVCTRAGYLSWPPMYGAYCRLEPDHDGPHEYEVAEWYKQFQDGPGPHDLDALMIAYRDGHDPQADPFGSILYIPSGP